MRRRGFTLIEVAIVAAIIAIVLGPLLEMAVACYREFHHAAIRSDLRSQASSASHRVFGEAKRAGGAVVDDDNRGVQFPGGDRVRWQEDRLVVEAADGQERLLTRSVKHFSAHRDGELLVLTLELSPETGGTYRGYYEEVVP